MYIRLDVFAGLLRVRPGELLHASRTDGMLEGMSLPARRQVRGAALMFDQAEATAFAAQWHARVPDAPPTATGEPLVPLDVFAKKVGVPPLAIWQAVSRSNRLRGITLPLAVKTGGQLLFEPAAVAKFVNDYRNAVQTR